MIKRKHTVALVLAILLLMTALGGCGKRPAAPEASAPAASTEPVVEPAPAAPAASPEPAGPAEATEAPAAQTQTGRRDGERFEDVIILEGMEEPVRYEHIRNDALGFEMDYDYENFVRHSE